MHKKPRRHDAAGDPCRLSAFQAQQEGCVFTQGELGLGVGCITFRVQGKVVGCGDILGNFSILLHGDQVVIGAVRVVEHLPVNPGVACPGDIGQII